MATNHEHEHEHLPEVIDTSKGYEASDVRISGILVFMLSMVVFTAVVALLTYGVGKVLNKRMATMDGPPSKWAKTVDVRTLGNMPTSPALESKFAELTQQYPTPRLQNDDGNQDIVDLHTREDLLLKHYSWVDQSKGKVRIPIERAMELIAARGLPVVQSTAGVSAPLLMGDENPVVVVPLTNGFARTGYEQELAEQGTVEAHPVQQAK